MTYEATVSTDRGLYRSRDGIILGVCRGIAERLDISVFWTRVLTVIGICCSGLFLGLAVYFLAGLLMKPEPATYCALDSADEFDCGRSSSRAAATDRLRRTYESLNRRLHRMESMVTSRDYDWESRLGS